ncbi:MAG: outer membrane lipoprotein carrier protein LolA [Alphaproteobacteria bacterium]|nr:outer membrane lipoprotein carrier protein LolA [Alphaproteobacteria bacterium]MCB9928149.1 outer membrane lipoprotein carrier protein LolA [Alphaproteobacteria bacterium]
MLRLLLVLLVAVTIARPALALTDSERAEVERLRQYLNGVTTMEADFLQNDNQGGVATGHFWLHRPGRLRFEYDPPVPILVVARGSFLVYYDKSLKETNYLDQKDTPAWFLLADKVTWNDDFTVTKVEHKGPIIEVSATRRSAPEQGAVTLVFERDPIRLLGWWLIDGNGRRVQVRLRSEKLGQPIDPEMFQFRPTNY